MKSASTAARKAVARGFCPAPRRVALAVALTFAPFVAQALDIAQVPVFAGGGGGGSANILYIHDDSDSMDLHTCIGYSNATGCTIDSSNNTLWYRPNEQPNGKYDLPLDHTGTPLPNAPLYPNSWADGYKCRVGVDCAKASAANPKYQNAYDAASDKQDFSNWYSYYHTRNLAAKAGVSKAFQTLPENVRLGWGKLSNAEAAQPITDQGVQVYTAARKKAFYDWLFGMNAYYGTTPLKRVLDKAGTYFDKSASGDLGPWADIPPTDPYGVGAGTGDSGLACRKSFTILMTDGLNNRDWDIGNQDDLSSFTTPPKPNGARETWTTDPFRGSEAGTLADIAWHYWSRDLLPENKFPKAKNEVPGTTRDPAFWQHMTTFTISFGIHIQGEPGKEQTAFANADSGQANTWLSPTDEKNGTNNARFDDLLHTAVNGHGDSFDAKTAQAFTEGLESILGNISVSINVVAPVTANSTSLTNNTMLYSSSFDSAGWSGELKAENLCTVTTVPACAPPGSTLDTVWTANFPANRLIKTWDGPGTPPGAPATAGGVNFEAAKLTTAQSSALGANPASIVGAIRAQPLGDIINSGILYTNPGRDNYGWQGTVSLNATQRSAYTTRMAAAAQTVTKATVLVGANDGMLHAFDAQSGLERFAYVPNAAYEHLKERVSDASAHRYFVDGTPVAGDIYMSSANAWRNLVVTSTGAGGRAYFALDVETPNNPKVLWEVSGGGDNVAAFPPTSADFASLGVTIGKATIAHTGSAAHPWVAIFGNGYNSRGTEPHKARLFIVNAETGAFIRNISTNVGSAATGGENGLASPLVVDYDNNGVADAAYAGDLQGNLWKFDLSASDPASWSVAFNGKPLFKAVDPSGKAQPITAQPKAMKRKGYPGEVLVYVGTGRYFSVGDHADTQVQSFYGVSDPCGNAGSCGTTPGASDSSLYTRSGNLTEQTLTSGGVHAPTGMQLRVLSANALAAPKDKGFYFDLVVDNNKEGERVLAEVLMEYDRIFLSTLTPVGGGSSNSCSGGSTGGWLYEFDPWSGRNQQGLTALGAFDGTYGASTSGIKTDGSGGRAIRIGDSVYDGTEPQPSTSSASVVGRKIWRAIR
ncbi:MAG: hypothetical protein LBR88_03100 [Zoogloeaceae bacterium]|nr:hypothetical protein [Zoogloeaceae bacterium]